MAEFPIVKQFRSNLTCIFLDALKSKLNYVLIVDLETLVNGETAFRPDRFVHRAWTGAPAVDCGGGAV